MVIYSHIHRHEFHKKCIDPWLKIKRNCPMCKQDVFPSKRSQSTLRSNGSNNTGTGRRNEARATQQQHVAVLTLSGGERNRSWSSSDSDDNSSSIVGSSDAASNVTQETEASLVDTSGSGGDVDGAVVLRVVGPLVSSEQAQQLEGEGGGMAESEMNFDEGRVQREERENSQQSSTSSSEQVSVDIEGVNLLRPSSVVHA